jgi:threonine dehydrogenase-like Zn-dependent dehydrogenase
MRGTILHGPGDVRWEERADPIIVEPTDAIVRTVASCVCGSDLWPYRGMDEVTAPRPIGHGTAASWRRSAKPSPP